MCGFADQSTVLYVAGGDRQATVEALGEHTNLDVTTTQSVSEAISRLSTSLVDCVISEYSLPDGDGISLLQQVRTEFDSVPFVLYPANGSESIAIRAFRNGVTDYVSKGGDGRHTALSDRVQTAIKASPRAAEFTVPNADPQEMTTQFDLALDGTNTGIWGWNLDTGALLLDERAEQLVGYEPGEFPGTYEAFTEQVHPDDLGIIEAAREQAIDTGYYEAEFRVVDDSTERWLHTRAELLSDDGTPDQLLGVGWDITKRKARQQELEATQTELEELATRLELALEETNSGVWQLDLRTREAVWDEACYQLFDYDPSESREVFELFTNRVLNDDLQTVERNMQHAIETNSDYQSDFRIKLPNGEQRWIRSRGCVQYDDHGEPARLLGIETDITEQKRAERAVEATKEIYQRIFRLSEDYLTVVDESGTITDVTPGIERVLGHNREAVIGTSAFDYIHPDDEDRLRELHGDVVTNPEMEIDFEYRSQTADGSYRWMEARGNNHLDDALLEGIVLNIRDISERKEREQKLTETTTQLRRKNEQLERLARIISHDLQTPLSTAQKLTGLLRTDLGEIEPPVDQSLADLEATHDRLQAFAERLPRLARESTAVEGPTECDLREIAEAAWQVVETGSLELRIESNRTLRADPERLQRAFENLIQNTVTHAVEAVETDEADSTTKATNVCVGMVDDGFYIADDGPGISAEQQQQVFEYGMSTGSGTGFGLAIVRTIVEAHGWTVDVAEHATGGARFEIHTETDYE